MVTTTTYKEQDDKPITPVVLLKFGQLEHLQDLLDNGTLYVNSVQNLRDGNGNDEEEFDDEGNHRYDSAEGAHEYVSTGPATATLQIKNSTNSPITIPIINFNYYDKYEYILGNICSFYGITLDCFQNQELIPIDSRMKKFGPYFILIKDHDEFLNRIHLAVEKTTRVTWWRGYVKYYDEKTYTGKLNMFKKRSRFSFQKEFRTYFVTDSKEPIKLTLGSLHDIATIIPSDIIEHFQIKMNPSGKQCNIRWPILKEV